MSSVIGRGTPRVVGNRMPTQEETIAAMELLRKKIFPPVRQEGEATPPSAETQSVVPATEAQVSHDLRSGRR